MVLTVSDILNILILSLLCLGSYLHNFVIVRNIPFIIFFLLNDIIVILFHLSNTYVLNLSGINRSNAGNWWEKKLREGIETCLGSQLYVWVLNLWKIFITKWKSEIIVWSPSNLLLLSSPFARIWSDNFRKV